MRTPNPDPAPTGSSTKTRGFLTGILLAPARLLRGNGTGASSPRRLVLLLAALASLTALAVIVGTALAADAAPTVTTAPAEAVGITTARFSGTVNPQGAVGEPSVTPWFFQVSPVGQEAWSPGFPGGVIEGAAAEESNPVAVEEILGQAGELNPATEYEFRLFAEDGSGSGETTKPYPTFTTEAAVATPTLTLANPTEVSYTTAHLSGTVDPEGGNPNHVGGPAKINWQLQFAPASEPTAWQSAGAGTIEGTEAESSSPIAVEAPLSGLHPHASYVTRLLAIYAGTEKVVAPEEPSFETLLLPAPTVTIEAPTGKTGTTAHVSGHIDPNSPAGDPEAADVTWRFRCPQGCSGTGTEGQLAAGTANEEVSGTLEGLVPGAPYEVFLVAENAAGPVEAGPESFLSPAVAPTITATHADHVSLTEATLHAEVDPGGAESSYFFQYGPTEAYGHTTPAGSLTGELNSAQQVSAQITGLSPGTTYHYRLVATSTAQEAEGADAAFRTLANSAVGGGCPNEAFRVGPSAALPDCRAYEMVTPAENGEANVYVPYVEFSQAGAERNGIPTFHPFQAALDGEAIDYVADPTVGGYGRGGAGIGTLYQARRAPAGGWTQSVIEPSRESVEFEGFSGDLSASALAWGGGGLHGTEPPLSSESPPPSYKDLFVQQGAGGTYQPLYTATPHRAPGSQTLSFAGVSADWSQRLFTADDDLLPEGSPLAEELSSIVEEEVGNEEESNYLYDNSAGRDSLVDVLPDGEVASGVSLGESKGLESQLGFNYSHLISADGSRVYWGDAKDGDLYLRENPTRPQSALAAGGTGTATLVAGSSAATSLRADVGKATLTSFPGTGTITAGSAIIAHVHSAFGTATNLNFPETTLVLVSTGDLKAFSVGDSVSGPGIPSGTTILAVGEMENQLALTLSKATTARFFGNPIYAEGPAPFVAGQEITAEGIPTGTTITAVAAGSLTLSAPATASAEEVAFTAGSDQLTHVHSQIGFQVGEPIFAEGIPAGTTVTAVGTGTLTLSAAPTAAGRGVTLFSEGPDPFEPGQPISGEGIPAGTTISAVSARELTLSAPATVSLEGVAISAGGECTEPGEACTYQVDAAEAGAGESGGGVYWTASNDGSFAFFTDAHRLTADATAQPGAPDLYRYDADAPVGSRLTDLTVSAGEPASVQGVIGVSEDGGSVYFVARGDLGADANGAPIEGQPNLYLWREGQAPRFIATLSPEDKSRVRPFISLGVLTGDWPRGLATQTAAVTPDGDAVVFMSIADLTGQNDTGSEQVYVYQAGGNRLLCASCGTTGEPPTTSSFLPVSWSNNYLPHWISADGDRVFFDTGAALVPADTNHNQDVYEWEREGAPGCPAAAATDGGCVSLLSSGTSPDASWLEGESASGDDVFIATRSELTPEDENENIDLYDARVGGVRSVSSVVCEGREQCRRSEPTPPSRITSGSSSFRGPGNPPAKQCKKGFTRKHGKCVKKRPGSKHHKKRHTKHRKHRNKRANSDRGGRK